MLEALRDPLDGLEIARANSLACADLGPEAPLALIVGVAGGPNRLLRARAGRLEELPLTELADPFGAARALAAADLDGDGIEEIWVANGEPGRPEQVRADRLFDRAGDGFRDLLAEPGAGLPGGLVSGFAVRPLDRLGTGQYGFLVGPTNGPLRLIEREPSGGLVDAAECAGLDELVAASALAAGPLLGPGPDLFVGALHGPSALFQATSHGRWSEVGEAVGLLVPDLGAADAALLEVDGAGTRGLLCLRRRGSHLLWVPSPTGLLRELAPPTVARPSAATCLLVADLDNDGHEEILIGNAGEPNRLLGWREQGWRPLDPGDALEPASLPTGMVAADLDGDGRLEVLIARTSGRGGGLACYRVEERSGGWLRVAPRTPQGAPARGALVRLVADGREQLRVVGEAGRGAGEPVAHFGLGSAMRVERVDVRWPDGAVRRLTDLEPGRTLHLPHPLVARC